VVSALSTKILLPNETYVFPVPLRLTGGATSVDNVNQLSTFFLSHVYAYGDLISIKKIVLQNNEHLGLAGLLQET